MALSYFQTLQQDAKLNLASIIEQTGILQTITKDTRLRQAGPLATKQSSALPPNRQSRLMKKKNPR
ncbi:MAG: hypothetical protein ACJA2X_002009 [Halocynthiibacter sp.]|jgi:hypothetical protein